MKRSKRCFSLILAVFFLLLAACGGAPEHADAVTLWVLEGTPLSAWLEGAVEEYNGTLGRNDSQPVLLRSFPDEQSLAAAFDTARPDLLLCTHERAFTLAGEEILRPVAKLLAGGAPAYSPAWIDYSPCLGQSYFPMGFDTQVLYARAGAADGAGGDLAALLELAARYGQSMGRPFFGTDSLSSLLYSMMLSLKVELHAVRQMDINSNNYIYAYNLLAGAAFTGGLLTGEDAAALVQKGELRCAAVSASALTQAGEEDCVFSPLPQLREEDVLLAEGYGLAVTARESRDLDSAAAFLRWLFQPDRLCEAALSCGLIPSAPPEAAQGQGPLEELLLELARTENIHLPMPGSDFSQNRQALEAELRTAMSLLA